jgi:fructoselysine-6-P-deglycase FrlB-like protein
MTITTASFKPIPSDLASTLARAVEQGDELRRWAHDLIGAGVSEIFLVGCGGSFAATWAAHYVLETQAVGLSVWHLTSAEFTYRRPARLGANSLVVVGSHTGSTPETLAAIETARAAGAKAVLGITRSAESPLGQAVDGVFTYGSDDVVWPPKQIIQLQLAYGLLEASGMELDYMGVRAALAALSTALPDGVERYEETCRSIATSFKDEPVIYVLGAGPNYGSAYGLAMCYLQEMQWLHAASLHAGEFFHGGLEVVTEDVPVLVLLGEDATRPIAQRAVDFVQRYSPRSLTVDSRDFELPGVAADHRHVVSPVVLMQCVSRLAAHFAGVRDHPLTLRRYMTKVAY